MLYTTRQTSGGLMKRVGFLLAAAFSTLILSATIHAQTNPTAQSLPYSQNFSSLAASSTTYPAGWQGWRLSTSGASSAFRTTAPTADLSLTASSSASTNAGGVHNYNGKIGFLQSGSSDPSLALAINTSGLTNVQVAYDAMTIRNPYDGTTNTRINEMTLQYRVGTSGAFTSLTGIEYQNNTTTQTGSGVTTPQNSQSKTITLPAACNNQAVVQLRWAARDVSGAGARASFAVDNISVTGAGPFFRSAASGNWNANATWEMSTDGTTWVAATTTPTSANGSTTVRSPHTVTVTANVDADQMTVDSGGTVSVNNGVTFTVADGAGTDLTDNGTVATAGNITNNGQAVINNTLQIDQGGFPGGGTGTYSYDQTNGVLVFNNSSGSFGVNNVNFWPTTNGPQNVNVKGAGGITMNVARTVGLLFQYAAGVSGANNLTLNGTSQVNNGGFTSGSPTYR